MRMRARGPVETGEEQTLGPILLGKVSRAELTRCDAKPSRSAGTHLREPLSSEEGSRRASKHSRAAADALSVLLSHCSPKGQIMANWFEAGAEARADTKG